ncbi:hypothetical protein L9F63_002459, partial [Diploptera punctata]
HTNQSFPIFVLPMLFLNNFLLLRFCSWLQLFTLRWLIYLPARFVICSVGVYRNVAILEFISGELIFHFFYVKVRHCVKRGLYQVKYPQQSLTGADAELGRLWRILKWSILCDVSPVLCIVFLSVSLFFSLLLFRKSISIYAYYFIIVHQVLTWFL